MLLTRSFTIAALVLTCGFTTACAHTRFVQTYCLTRQQFEELKRSQPERVKSQLTGQADKDIRIIAGNAIRLRAHDDGLLTVLGGCVQP